MNFTLFPAIDVKDGQVVRLEQGIMDRSTVFATDPLEQVEAFARVGAPAVHIVDLNGAFAGKSVNGAIIRRMIERFPGITQVGGGIRSMEAITDWFSVGVGRCILGTSALKDPELIQEAAQAFPGRIIVAIDARDGYIATDGWAEKSSMTALDLAQRVERLPLAALLYTDISRDGLLQGVNIEGTKALAEACSIPVIASGGLSGDADIDALIAANEVIDGRIEGVIAGRAIYDGRIDIGVTLRRIEQSQC